MKHDVKDIRLAADGKRRIEWADRNMPVVTSIRESWEKSKPLAGVRIAACLHVTSETANLMRTLKAGGAGVALCASNPLSTQDEVAAALVKHYGVAVFAVNGEDNKRYYRHIAATLDLKPQITMDDGADLVSVIHSERKGLIPGIWGGTEETTTGVIRLRSMARQGVLGYPIIAVNDAKTKHLFDNRYGTGQSTIDGIIRATNHLLAGSVVVVAGYGWCGRGVAQKARGLGAQVVVCEIDPLKGLEARMDGFQVMTMAEAARIGEVFVTATGNISVIRPEHALKMKDGAVIANTGHFNVEIDVEGLKRVSRSRRRARPFVEEYLLKNGRRVCLLAEGRLINLSAAEGHPAQVMDMSFANQALCVRHLCRRPALDNTVYAVPEAIDARVARLKLKAMGIKIDRLTPEQKRYLSSWDMGT